MPYNILAEFGSTALMIIFGVGVHCDTVLKGTKYQGSGHMFAITTWSFGSSVCLFIFGGSICMNPAMALAQCILGLVPWSMFIPYVIAEMLGGFVGAVAAWFMYKDEFKDSEGVVDPIAQRNIFSTNPTRNNLPHDFFCEAFCTFFFISGILAIAHYAGDNLLLCAICVGLLVWAVGMGMGGITGFAMNQARDEFSAEVTRLVEGEPLIEVVREEVRQIPEGPCVIAAGPLWVPAFFFTVALSSFSPSPPLSHLPFFIGI